jgi:hypothetical protein
MEIEKQSAPTKPTAKRRTVLIIGGVVLAFSVYLLAFLVPDVLATVSGAETMTLAHAAEVATDESIYVRIEDGIWDCDTITYVRGRSSTNSLKTTTRSTEIFLADDKSEIVVLASMSGEMTCGDFDGRIPVGYLTQMSSAEQQTLTNEARLARFFDANSFLALCGYCGTENSMIGAIFGVVIAVAGIGIIVLGLRMPKDD